MRPVSIETNPIRHAEGSASIELGGTRVLCVASVEDRVPAFLKGSGSGWVTAEYGMLPRATHTRSPREAAVGRQGGRTQEIQRLIGRSLRSVTELRGLGERTITLDCDVLQADGGTRCAAITGACVALALALAKLVRERTIPRWPLRETVAATSVGICAGQVVLDLAYVEDSEADVDCNVVGTLFGPLRGGAGHGGAAAVLGGEADRAPRARAPGVDAARRAPGKCPRPPPGRHRREKLNARGKEVRHEKKDSGSRSLRFWCSPEDSSLPRRRAWPNCPSTRCTRRPTSNG